MPLDLTAAINEVEAAQAAYANTASVIANDQATVSAAQQKLTAAQTALAADQSTQATAAAAFNSSLNDLIASATAAMIPAAGPTPDPNSPPAGS